MIAIIKILPNGHFYISTNNQQPDKCVSNNRYQIEMAEKIDNYSKYRNKSLCDKRDLRSILFGAVLFGFRIVSEINGVDSHDRSHE